MKEAIIIFDIIATAFALASIAYVAVDILLDRKKEPEPVPVVVAAPVPVPEPEVIIPIVDHIDAEEADELLSDAEAMKHAETEEGGGVGKKGEVNIGDIDKCFEEGEVITLDLLKRRGLVGKKFGRVKILADGVLTKSFTVKAEAFSVQAIKMIELTGGKVIILK